MDHKAATCLDICENLFSLVDGKLFSSSNVYKSVADAGVVIVGLTYEDPALKLLNDGVDVKSFIQKKEPSFAWCYYQNIKHMENAKIYRFLSQDIQDKLGTENNH